MRKYASNPALAGGTPVHFICYEFRVHKLVRLEENPADELRAETP